MATLFLFSSCRDPKTSLNDLVQDILTLELTWDPEQKAKQLIPTSAFPILCGQTPLSFSHLKPPYIFLHSNSVKAELISESLKQTQDYAIIAELGAETKVVIGVVLQIAPPTDITASYGKFLDWLGTTAKILLENNSSYLLKSDSNISMISEQEHKILKIESDSIIKAKRYDATVVIPLYNGLQYTRELWTSIKNNSVKAKLEYIFVDNNSSDGTKEWLKQFKDSNVVCILNDENRNFAGACNQGAAVASSPIVIFLNSDTEITNYWADPLIEILNTRNQVGAVGNKQLFPGNCLVHHAGIYVDLSGHPKHYLEGCTYDDPRIQFERSCQAVTGACLAIRKNDFLEVGSFSEEYRNGYEDIDLCLSLIKKGAEIIYTPQSVIYHHVSKSPGRTTHNHYNWQLFNRRCMPLLNPDLEEFIRQNEIYAR
jgi:GT2 family glycosyltransferase